MHFCPRNIPAVISDTLVTDHRFRKNIITPSAINAGVTLTKSNKARLARKIYAVSPDTVTIWSGNDTSKIRECLNTAREWISAWSTIDRPMSRLAKAADDHEGVEVIGVYVTGKLINYSGVVPTECFVVPGLSGGYISKLDINVVSPHTHYVDMGFFQRCSAIGEGRISLFDQAANYCELVRNRGRENFRDVYSVIRNFSHGVNSRALRREMIGGELNDWGGFYEFSAYDITQRRWTMGPSFVSIFGELSRISGNRFTTYLHNQYYAYDPGIDHGRVLSMYSGETNPKNEEYLIENLLMGPEKNPVSTREYWSNWKPQNGNISMMLPDGRTISLSLSGRELANISFFEAEHGFKIEVDKTYWDEVSAFIVGRANGIYVPS